MKIRFPERGTSGRSVAMIKNLEFGFEDKVGQHALLMLNSVKIYSGLCHIFVFMTSC